MGKRLRENGLRLMKSIYYMDDPKKITKDIQKNKVSGEEAVNMTLYLKNKGLVNYESLDIPMKISLTDKGMEYVISELKQERQEEFNKIVAFTGAILALVAIYDFIIKNFDFTNYQINLVVLKVVFLLILISCIAPLAAVIFNYWEEIVCRK